MRCLGPFGIAVVLRLVASLQLSAAASAYPTLERLYTNREFFELRDTLRDHGRDRSMDLLFYRGVVASKFNQPQSSIGYLQNYLKQADGRTDPARLVDCHEMLADSYLKTYQYRKSADAYSTILTTFQHQLGADQASAYENSARLWGALRSVPPQGARFNGDSTIQTSRNLVGVHVPVEFNTERVSMLFDTGANLSVVARSFAAKLGFKIIDASIEVGAITGNKVRAQVGIAPPMRMGNVTIRNAVFLVFKDDAELPVDEHYL